LVENLINVKGILFEYLKFKFKDNEI